MYNYKTVTQITDLGPHHKADIGMPEEIGPGMVHADTFNVYVERKNIDTGEIIMTFKTWMGPRIYRQRAIGDCCGISRDENGSRADRSKYVAIEMPMARRIRSDRQ